MAESRVPVRINHLCCPICSDVFRNPATIPCGHNFCMQCIEERWDGERTDECPCSCPQCGQWFTSTPKVIKNTTLAELVRDSHKTDGDGEKRKQCSGESLPSQAQKRHHSCTETSGNPLCERHSSPLDLYCCSDQQVICAFCASTKHRGHTIGCVGEERRRRQVHETNSLLFQAVRNTGS